MVKGAFAQNFIQSSRFQSFVSTYSQSILFNLKHLRLCELTLDNTLEFGQALNSFCRTEKLDIIRFKSDSNPKIDLDLNLPMLNRVRFMAVNAVHKVSLNTPKLQKIKLVDCDSLVLYLVHGESVEWLCTDRVKHLEVKKLKNLKQLYTNDDAIDPTLLYDLDKLNEIYLNCHSDISNAVLQLFDQKRSRPNLKIYLFGLLLLLNDPNDPIIKKIGLEGDTFMRLVENPSRLTDEIPLQSLLDYTLIESLAPEMQISLLNRFIDLSGVIVLRPVQSIQNFLDFLNNFEYITELRFFCDLPQDLFDLLPDQKTVQGYVLHESGRFTLFVQTQRSTLPCHSLPIR